MRKNTYMILYKIQHATSTEASSLIQNISVAHCVQVNDDLKAAVSLFCTG